MTVHFHQMLVLKLSLWIIAYTAGIARLSLAVVLLVRNRQKEDFWKVVFLLVFAVIVLSLSNVDTQLQLKIDLGNFFGNTAGYCSALLIMAIPLYTHYSIHGLSHLQIRNGIFIVLSSVFVLLLTVQFFIPLKHRPGQVMLLTIITMSAAILYSMTLMVLHLQKKTSLAGKFIPFVTIALIPPMVIFDFIKNMSKGYIFMPILYLILNVLMILDEAARTGSPTKALALSKEKMQSFDLTEREQEVSECLLKGLTYHQTAEKLFISVQTVKTHANRIYTKTASRNKLELLNKISGK
ncbi:MAG: helix-turn-helix transcriptional regulator [Spirochaetales bacterium]|nr:helix-turn-helix transcriptional regulator [Spirochaetales bacterium]